MYKQPSLFESVDEKEKSFMIVNWHQVSMLKNFEIISLMFVKNNLAIFVK
jgi:hypothetical protein